MTTAPIRFLARSVIISVIAEPGSVLQTLRPFSLRIQETVICFLPAGYFSRPCKASPSAAFFCSDPQPYKHDAFIGSCWQQEWPAFIDVYEATSVPFRRRSGTAHGHGLHIPSFELAHGPGMAPSSRPIMRKSFDSVLADYSFKSSSRIAI